jgi:hypothetical protein
MIEPPARDSNGDGSDDGSRKPVPPIDDPNVIRVVEEYLATLEAGQTPDRKALQARHPEIADALGVCLDMAEFVRGAGSKFELPADATQADGLIHCASPLGDFRLLREIGRGGMGVVYEALQLSLGRHVALKVLPFAAALDPKQLQRFKNEAQAAAQLHHTHIVPVFGVGVERGVHYYAMQLIEGRTLAAWIAEGKRCQDPFSGVDVRAQIPTDSPKKGPDTFFSPFFLWRPPCDR